MNLPGPPRLVRGSAPGPQHAVRLDATQAQVVAQRSGSGPLRVLGAPGTGKTTVLVEAVLARVSRDGVAPDGVLVLAPSRQSAAYLRDQVTARLGRTVREPLARSPHSFAFGVLRRAAVLHGDPAPRLLSGPEQDRILADLLAGHASGHGRSPRWPAEITAEVRALRGFREELRDLLMRATERGLSPQDLAALGDSAGRADWVAAARVMQEYLQVTQLATPGGWDPAAIVDGACDLLLSDGELLAAERARWRFVAVDDAHDLTPPALRLVRALAGPAGDVLITGDPDATTQSFRGADPRLFARADEEFAGSTAAPARTVVLGTAWRQPPALRAVTRRVAERIASSGVVAQRAASAREGPGGPEAEVGVHVLRSPGQEAAFIARELREAHLRGNVPWSAMAVVVRSAGGMGALRRGLTSAGVPVALPAAEVAVRDEPAVRPLRLALHAVLSPAGLTPEVAQELVSGPIGGADAVTLRRLRAALRERELAAGGGRASDVLLAELLGNEDLLPEALPGRHAVPARRVAGVLAAGRAALADRAATAETVLWALWAATGLAEPWRRTALAGGAAGSRADRDLDAVVALFDAAARYVDRLPPGAPHGFLEHLEAHEVPADTLAERAPGGERVQVLTAQAAAGREWEVVAVAGVQEGLWPDLRLRGSLLGSQQLVDLVARRIPVAPQGIGRDPTGADRRAVLDDELRLFHVAVSRARRRLIVTAVRTDEQRPSALLDLVVPPAPGDEQDRPLTTVLRPVSLAGLVAELRAVLSATPQRLSELGLRSADVRDAAAELARLADAGVPGADPATWYGLQPWSDDGPLREAGQPVSVSPSRVEAFDRCGLRWLLEASGGQQADSLGQSLGTLVHRVASELPDGDEGQLSARLDELWHTLGLPSGWYQGRQRVRAQAMIRRLAGYLAEARNTRSLVGTEVPFEFRAGRASVRGQIDRLERDDAGRLVVVDLKTGTAKPKPAELARLPQLGIYQQAVAEGCFDSSGEPGGAALVQLGSGKVGSVQPQAPLGADGDSAWVSDLLNRVAEQMAGATFVARVNDRCARCPVRTSCPVHEQGRELTS